MLGGLPAGDDPRRPSLKRSAQVAASDFGLPLLLPSNGRAHGPLQSATVSIVGTPAVRNDGVVYPATSELTFAGYELSAPLGSQTDLLAFKRRDIGVAINLKSGSTPV
jgi:hypothetical protein